MYLMNYVKECGSFIFCLLFVLQKINVPHGGDVSELLLMSFCMFVVFKWLPITFWGFVQLGKSKLKCSFQHKSQIEKLLLMLAHQPQLHKTDVTCRFFVGNSQI